MKVYLRKNIEVGDIKLSKNEEGWVWCCLLHNDSFIVTFKTVRVEIHRTDLDFPTSK